MSFVLAQAASSTSTSRLPWIRTIPTTLGLEPTYGTNAPANVFPKITIDALEERTGSGCIAEGAGCGENGNIDAVLGEGIYIVSDVLTLIRGRHTIKVGGEYDRFYQNYTNWGDISSGNFEFNGSVTGIPYADFLSGNVYGWFVYESDPTSAHMKLGLFGSDDFKVSSHLTLNLGLRWQMQSGWGVNNNLFGNYDPFLPNSADGGLYRGAILFGGQGDTVYGGSTTNLTTIQNGDYKEFAPRIGVAWSPRDKWSVRASYGIFDAPRDAENYTDGALGLGFNPHTKSETTGTSMAVRYSNWTGAYSRLRHGRLSDAANSFVRPSRTLAAWSTIRGVCRLRTFRSSSLAFSTSLRGPLVGHELRLHPRQEPELCNQYQPGAYQRIRLHGL